jgi:hypothetical protein
MIPLYWTFLNGFSLDKKTDETFVQNRIEYQKENMEDGFMDNSRTGWFGFVYPVIVLITLIAVTLVGLYDCTSSKNKELDNIRITNLSEYIVPEQ